MDLHDGVLQQIVKRLGVDRRTVMMVCRRLRDLAQGLVHSHQLPGMSVQDAIEAAEPGDTVHLLPGFYKEALLLKQPLHLTCDSGPGEARILSPARFAIMALGRGCLLENLVLKSHQIDESVFFLVEFGPLCKHIRMRHCEVLQGSYIGIQDLKDDHTSLCLEHCLLHVGISLMAGRLDMTDCQIKCTGDSLWTHPDTTLVMRRCSFVDVADPVTVQSSTAVIQGCSMWAYERGPLQVCCEELPLAEQVALINEERLLHMEKEPPRDVWIELPRGAAGPEGVRATGRRASSDQRRRVEAGELLPGRVVLWGNRFFESRSNAGITAQQEEVRREARAIMEQMQREMELGDGMDPDDFSIGNSIEDPEPAPGEDSDDSDDWDSEDDWEGHADAGLNDDNAIVEHGVIDLVSSDGAHSGSSSSGDDGSSSSGDDDSSSDDDSSLGGGPGVAVALAAFLPAEDYLQAGAASTSSGEGDSSSSAGTSSTDDESLAKDSPNDEPCVDGLQAAGDAAAGAAPGAAAGAPCAAPAAAAAARAPASPGAAVSSDDGASSGSDGSSSSGDGGDSGDSSSSDESGSDEDTSSSDVSNGGASAPTHGGRVDGSRSRSEEGSSSEEDNSSGEEDSSEEDSSGEESTSGSEGSGRS